MILATEGRRNAQFVAKTQRFVAPKRRSIAPNGAWLKHASTRLSGSQHLVKTENILALPARR
jgi:hypothetical protein